MSSTTIIFFTVIFALFSILVKQAREQYLPVIAIAVLIAFLPLNQALNFWSISIMSTLIVLTFIFNIILTFIFSRTLQFKWQPIFYVIISVFLLNVAGLLHTGNFTFANNRIDSSVPLILFPIVFSMVQLSKRNVLLLLRFFVWIVIAVCVYGFLSYAIAVSEFSWEAALLEGKQYAHLFTIEPITRHPSALSIILLMALPVSLYLRYHDGKQITLVEMLLAILLPIVVVFVVGARIGVVVFPVLLGLGYLFYCKFKPVLKWGLAATGAIVGLCLILFVFPPEMKNRFSDPIRVDLRNTAISAIKEKPVFGWGTWQQRNLIACEERAQSLGIETIHVEFSHFHNVYLDSMVQFGIIGIVVLLLLIFWTFWIAIRKKHFLLLSFIVMYVIVFYVDVVLQSGLWLVSFVFWFCFLIANWKYLVERTSARKYDTTCAISRYWGGKNQYTQQMKNALTIIGVKPLPIWFGSQADFVWLHWFENKAGKKSAYRFLEKCKKKGMKVIWNVHNKIPHRTKNQDSSKSFMKHLTEVSDKIVIHSTETTGIVAEVCENNETVLKKIVYVPHPNYIEVYGPQKPDRNLDNNKLKLCFFGAVKKYKNVELLISAVTELGFEDIELNIYGRSRPRKYAESLRLLAEKNNNINMHFKFVSDNDVPEILARCHLLVLPYNLDSSLNSGVTILAFSYGRTVLSSNTGTLEDIEDKSLFFAYSYNNQDEHKEELKKQITAIRDKHKGNYNELLKLGERCKEYVAENNSSEQVSKQLKTVFE